MCSLSAWQAAAVARAQVRRVGVATRTALLLVVLVLALSGCNRIFGTPLAGTWSGTYTSLAGGSGILLLQLEVSGDAVSGTWESSFPGAVVSGAVMGTAGEMVALQLVPTAVPECPYNALAEKSRDRLTGTYQSACAPLVTGGTFELRKQ